MIPLPPEQLRTCGPCGLLSWYHLTTTDPRGIFLFIYNFIKRTESYLSQRFRSYIVFIFIYQRNFISPCNAKRLKSFDLSLSCGRWDLNPHDVTTTRSLVLLVCQFRHFRVSGVSRFRISHRRILIYHTFSCLASTFLNFFYFFNSMFYLYNLYN